MSSSIVGEFAFLKFGRTKEHLQSFVEKGEIYINCYEFFKRVDANSKQFDIHEFADEFVQPQGVKIHIAGREFNPVSPFSISHTPAPFTHIFCLFNVQDPSVTSTSTVYDQRVWEDFGEYVVLIHNVKEFRRRIYKELASFEGLNAERNLVSYFDSETYHGELTPFYKQSTYSYQNEYRIAINYQELKGKPLVLNLGSMTDIAYGPVHKSQCKNKIEQGRIAV